MSPWKTISLTFYVFGFERWQSSVAFLAVTLLRRIGFKKWAKRYFYGLHGRFKSIHGQYDFRPDTLDGWILHPKHEAKSHARVAAALVERPGVLIDIGAHIGGFSLPHRDQADTIVFVEPFPDNVAALRANIALNRVDQKSIVIEAAAGKAPGSADLYLLNSDTHSLVPIPEAATLRVEVVSLDEVCQREGVRDKVVSVIKIDVEGAGIDVLQGGRALLETMQPSILVEALDAADMTGITDFMVSLGFGPPEALDGRNLFFPGGYC